MTNLIKGTGLSVAVCFSAGRAPAAPPIGFSPASTPFKINAVSPQGMPGMETGAKTKAKPKPNGSKKKVSRQKQMPGMMPKMKAAPMQHDQMSGMGMHKMEMPGMKGDFGPWSMSREGSGTSWQPDSSPMFMLPLRSPGGFDFRAMGIVEGGYVDDGGKRGDKGLFSNSMVMLMGSKEWGGGTLGLHLMGSLDPFIDGKRGVPNLFQSTFTVDGADVGNRKDPHNLFSELALSYSRAVSKDLSGFVYGGPVGEPALGNVMYFHRASGLEIPEAPITHDWFDGTHISFGVATIGVVYKDKLKLEGSAFNSAEPGLHLYSVGKFALNSASTRLSYNPTRDLSFSGSYGYLNSDLNSHRVAFSASYSHALPKGDNLSVTAYLGRNIVTGATTSNGWLTEATYFHAKDAIFARFERVAKDDIVGVPAGTFTINKLLLGDTRSFRASNGVDFGIGVYAGVYSFPNALNGAYGKSPVTLGLFLRVRPSAQPHDPKIPADGKP